MSDALTLTRPRQDALFTPEEIAVVREGVNGVKGMIPPRCYFDEDFYKFECEQVLKKNWLCVGRWDAVANPGDYFTTRMFGESIIVVRDKDGAIHGLVNACRHRWAQVVEHGTGSAKLFACPYHNWIYNLDGTLRGMAVKGMPEINKADCALHKVQVEVWQGFIFINFDPSAPPLAPQLKELEEFVRPFGIENFTFAGETSYDTTWNYKFSFETGYEAYHHEGIHKSVLPNTAKFHKPILFGKCWGVYGGVYERTKQRPFGKAPWISDEDDAGTLGGSIFIGIYPNLIMFLNTYQVTMITTEHLGVASNHSKTSVYFAPWARERDPDGKLVEERVEMMKYVQREDTYGCELLQKGVGSNYNTTSIIHPLESQLSHYYNWLMDQYLGLDQHPA